MSQEKYPASVHPQRTQPLRNYRGNYPAHSVLGKTLKQGRPLFWSPEENLTSTEGCSHAQRAQRFTSARRAACREVTAGLWEKGTLLGARAQQPLRYTCGSVPAPGLRNPACAAQILQMTSATPTQHLDFEVWRPGPVGLCRPCRSCAGSRRPEWTAGRGRMLAGHRASRSLEQLISWLLTEKRM